MSEPPTPSAAERRADKLIRRQERNLRKARAEGYLDGICAMLGPGDLVFDCGANVGDVTVRLAETGAEVVAFEPDPHAFARLSARTSAAANVTRVQAALGTAEGRAVLHRAEGFDVNPDGASVKSTLLTGGRGGGGGGVEVPVVDFPALVRRRLAERGEIAFVKMDIEGAELDILEALDAHALLGGIRCLVAETHERKFPALRPRFAALRAELGARYSARQINLDWI
ncbi:FkbM family methyltransferase [Rhodobacteraceae bacterium CCMM004]|nr:FkbM family methyltransferase [Rhodobacteraceae bacterium CCMM004]